MSDTPTHPQPGAETRIDRWRPWIAAVSSVLLHVLFLLILLWSAKQVVTTPQGATGGGRVRVNFIGESDRPEQPSPAPPSPNPAPEAKPPSRTPPRDRVEERKPVPQAEYVLREPEPQPERRESQDPPSPSQPQASAGSSPAPTRRPETWTGRPPGMLDEDTAPVDRGSARGPAEETGTAYDLQASEPSVEVGGFQIYYDLLAEERLRSWKEQGMKEISFPLPGMRSRMVCPVEIALRRGSGKCRLLDPIDPEMQAIGDARQVVVVMAVYRRGELVWRGPGPYR